MNTVCDGFLLIGFMVGVGVGAVLLAAIYAYLDRRL
jgi:hypothetical protein